MPTFLLVHGASANAGYWRYVTPLLEHSGHEAIAVELPTEDATASFLTYADAAVEQTKGRKIDVVVGQSLGAFTAGVLADRLRPESVVLLAPMIPTPGETPAEWAEAVGQQAVVREYAASIGVAAEFDPATTFFHDVPEEVSAALWAEGQPPQSSAIFDQPFPIDSWPAIPTRVIAGLHDRMFPWALQEPLSIQRLGTRAEPIPTGHLPAFARPELVAHKLGE